MVSSEPLVKMRHGRRLARRRVLRVRGNGSMNKVTTVDKGRAEVQHERVDVMSMCNSRTNAWYSLESRGCTTSRTGASAQHVALLKQRIVRSAEGTGRIAEAYKKDLTNSMPEGCFFHIFSTPSEEHEMRKSEEVKDTSVTRLRCMYDCSYARA